MNYPKQQNRRKLKRKILVRRLLQFPLVLLMLASLPGALKATHIVGGEISYQCLGNNQYEITLNVYRDCFFGAPDAPFDDPAFVNVYDNLGTLVKELEIAFVADDTLDAVLFDECLFVPENVCVHTTMYKDTVMLGFKPGGYTIVYQRCCRNETIVNIVNPIATGATYSIELTEEAMMACNASPTFQEWPPIFICINEPIFFDHSALDIEGDSLVYKLCQPFTGASLDDPKPKPSPPPFDTVVWVSPFYSTDNMLGGSDPLKINPVTGLMTGLPTIQGQFVVGVCVEEYDRETGDLLSVTRRDFQYNVGQCGTVVSTFSSPDAQCEDLTVDFENESDNADEFIWYFDFPNDLSLFSIDANPSFTFPDTGTYTIALIAEPNSACSDTSFQEIFLQNNSLVADFQVNVFDCQSDAIMEVLDLSADPISPVVAWEWVVQFGQTTLTSNEQNPSFNVPLSISGTVTLTATSQNGCIHTIEKPFESGLDNPGGFIVDTLYACEGDSIRLNPNTPEEISFLYNWEPANLLDDPTAVNPAFFANEPQTFSVTITPSNQVCEIIKTVHVLTLTNPDLNFAYETDCDGLTLNFFNNSLNADGFTWMFGDPENPDFISSETNPSYTFPDQGSYQVTLIGSNADQCFDTLTQEVLIEMIELEADFTVAFSDCTPNMVTVDFMDQSFNSQNNTISWEWRFSSGQTSMEQNPQLIFTESQILEVVLTITSEDGCTNTMTKNVNISVLEDIDIPISFPLCFGDTATLNDVNNPNYDYEWTPAIGLSDPSAPNPLFFPTETTTYTVKVTSEGADICEYTQEVIVEVTPPISINLNTQEIETCDQIATLSASTEIPSTFIWTRLETGIVLFEENNVNTSTLQVPVSGTQTYQVQVVDSTGCTQQDQITVTGGPVDVVVDQVITACLGEEIVIDPQNMDPNDTLTYNWEPADLFVPGTNNSANPDFIEAVGEYTVFVTIENQFGCSFGDTIAVAVVDTAIQLGFTHELQCNGATVEFTNTSTNAFNFVWDFGDNSTSTEENPIHTYTTPGVYTVSLSINYDVDCVETFTDTIEIIDPQIIANFDYDILSCDADSAMIAFFDRSTNSFGNTEQWSWEFSNGQVSSEQNPVIAIDQSGNLIVTLTIISANDCSATTTDTLSIELIELNIPDTIVLCHGDTTFLNPGGNENFSYQWSPSFGLDDPTVANPRAFPTETTTYSVFVENYASDTCSLERTVTVVVSTPLDAGLPDTTITCGEDVILTPMLSGLFNTIWSTSQGIISTEPSVSVNPFREETYFFEATDASGCSVMDTIVVIDNGVDVETNGDVAACAMLETEIGINNLDSEDILSISWSPLENILSDPTGTTITVFVEENTVTFTAIITNQHNCSDTVSINVSVVPFEVDIPEMVSVCPGVPTPLSPNANPNFTYNWSPETGLIGADTSNPIFIGTENTTYTVTVTDTSNGLVCQTEKMVEVIINPSINLQTSGDTTLCDLQEVILMATTDLVDTEILWFSGDFGTQLGMGNSLTVFPSAGQNNYVAIATDTFGCADTSLATINVMLLETGLPEEILVCSNTPTELNPSGNAEFEYNWEPETGMMIPDVPNPTITVDQDITYIVTVTAPTEGCIVVDTVNVKVLPTFSIEAAPDTAICTPSTLSFTASSTGAEVEFIWSDNRNFTTILSQEATLEVFAENSATYYVRAVDNNGCGNIDSVLVSLQPLEVDITPDMNLCEPIDAIELEVINMNPSQDLTYSWMPANAIIGVSDEAMVLVDPNVDSVFTVIVSNELGCTDTLSTSVRVTDLERLIKVTAEPTSIFVSESSQLNITGCPDCIIEWTPSSTLDNPNIPDPIASPEETTTYTVLATLGECSITADVTVEVNNICGDPVIFLPNAFTPNNDGENDILFLRGTFIRDMHLIIFNRWGQKVFETRDKSAGWDGTFQGEQLPPDVYGFYLHVICPGDNEYTRKGNITLLR